MRTRIIQFQIKKIGQLFGYKILKGLFAITLLNVIACQPESDIQPTYNAVQYVDPQIGSVHARWFFYTPAALPFGMVKLAPHTNAYESIGSWLPGGYDDRHNSIEGFGHFHEFQIGGVVVMPTTGNLKIVPGTLENPDDGYRSRFDKKDEHAEPGYYSVFLKDYGIKTEITATERVGFHRYTFPESKEARLIFDIGHKQGESSDVTKAYARLVNESEVEGYVETNPEYVKFCDPGNRVKMYFVARLNKIPESVGTFVESIIAESSTETKGVKNGLFLNFNTSANEVIEMQVGLSYCSIENARLNLETEATNVTFDEVHKMATNKWNKMLGRIQVDDENAINKTKFYTGLYHALLGRGLASDVNGQYKLNGDGTGQIPLDKNGKPKYNHFNTDGMWGGFWNLSQLWFLVYPGYFQQYLQSNIDFYKETGWLHDGVAAGAYTNGVQTNFQGLLIAGAYNCGFRDFDWETGYRAAHKNETEYRGRNLGNGKYDMHRFINLGYVPYEDTIISNGWSFNFGASHTLEYCFSSYAVAQMAKQLGKKEDFEKLMNQANYWKNIFDQETKFIRPKLPDGEFIKDFDPLKAWDGFQEGNAYQFTWFIPHDPAGLINKMGLDLFNERLETTFEESRKSLFGGGKEIDSFSGVQTLYNQGNQPCLHQSWLFNYSGKPWLTQKWTRTICDEFYGTESLHGYGYGQDEDQGQLGAWFVMNALGLFDVQGHANANPTFQFGSPLFKKVTIRLENSPEKTLVIQTENNSSENRYVQDVQFNKSNIELCWIKRSELLKGGTLKFTMGAAPNKNWGVETPPPSMSDH
ncbi:GH92 family glycosyl hydrolase [uncultured Draconibacterium sp.]|uniref:GH92 family glycosyl hydrolase n=1 Tax=uncultured Draconibacterium sp. TaxID=1573823 RepID=UPI0025D0ACC0|nr:GH92 family glycosyl hydrolase [uncultured Draconibacterium sp.]